MCNASGQLPVKEVHNITHFVGRYFGLGDDLNDYLGCRGKAISIEYFCVHVCVCVRVNGWVCGRVALLIQHATRRHIVICDLSGSIIFVNIFS